MLYKKTKMILEKITIFGVGLCSLVVDPDLDLNPDPYSGTLEIGKIRDKRCKIGNIKLKKSPFETQPTKTFFRCHYSLVFKLIFKLDAV